MASPHHTSPHLYPVAGDMNQSVKRSLYAGMSCLQCNVMGCKKGGINNLHCIFTDSSIQAYHSTSTNSRGQFLKCPSSRSLWHLGRSVRWSRRDFLIQGAEGFYSSSVVSIGYLSVMLAFQVTQVLFHLMFDARRKQFKIHGDESTFSIIPSSCRDIQRYLTWR